MNSDYFVPFVPYNLAQELGYIAIMYENTKNFRFSSLAEEVQQNAKNMLFLAKDGAS